MLVWLSAEQRRAMLQQRWRSALCSSKEACCRHDAYSCRRFCCVFSPRYCCRYATDDMIADYAYAFAAIRRRWPRLI